MKIDHRLVARHATVIALASTMLAVGWLVGEVADGNVDSGPILICLLLAQAFGLGLLLLMDDA